MKTWRDWHTTVSSTVAAGRIRWRRSQPTSRAIAPLAVRPIAAFALSLLSVSLSSPAWSQEPLAEHWNSFKARKDGVYCFGNEAINSSYSHWGDIRIIVADDMDDMLAVEYRGAVQYKNGSVLFFNEDFRGEWKEDAIRVRAKNRAAGEMKPGNQSLTWEQFALKDSLNFDLKTCTTEKAEQGDAR